TPADGPGQFNNGLDPHLELYDPSGAPIASGVPLGAGRNEYIELLHAPVAGTYRVRVTAENNTQGEYFLGATVGDRAPVVSNNLSTQSTQYSDPVAPVVVTATDIIGDPLAASTSFTKDGGPVQAGLPANLALTANGLTSADGFDTHTWTLTGLANVAPGTYVVTV